MKKNIIIVFLLFFLNVFVGIVLVQNREVFHRLPHQTESPLKDVSTAIVDENKNIFFIDREKQRIVKMSATSTVQFEITAEPNSKRYEYRDLAVDEKGRIYVHQVEFAPYSENIQSEKIVRFTADGKFDKEIYTFELDETEQNEHKIKSLYFFNNKLFLLMHLNENITLQNIDVEKNIVNVLVDKPVPSKLYLYEMAGIGDETILFSTKTGEMYQLKEDTFKRIFEAKNEEIGRGVPELLASGNRDAAYYYNPHEKAIVRLDVNNFKEQTFLKEADIKKLGYSVLFRDLQSLKINENGYFAVAEPDRIAVFDRYGMVESIYDREYFEQSKIFYQWLVWILPFVLLAGIVITIMFIYVKILHKNVSLMIKFAFLYVVTLAFAAGGISFIVYKDYSRDLTEKLFNEINNTANLLAQTIDGDQINNIHSPKQYMSDDYAKLLNFSDMPNYDIELFKYHYGKLYTLVSPREPMFAPHELTENERLVLQGERLRENEKNDLTVYRPVYDASGETVGIIKVTGKKRYLDNEKMKWLSVYKNRFLVVCSIATLFFILTSIYMIFPIRSFTKSVQEIAKGKWETAISINRLDELGILSQQVDRMTNYVKDHIDKITALNESYYRFVPQQFLQFLGKNSLLDVQLGDHTEEKKTILVFKMRSFYTFSKQLTPEENFKFINSFLKRFSPVINEHQGMINKYFGPGGLCLFSDNAQAAVKCAIAMRNTLYVYNYHRSKVNYQPINIGIAIHKGPMMLGVIGGMDRLEGAVISDDVNLTEVLESFSESLGVSIIATESVIEDIKGDGDILYRNLGIVNVSERNEPVQLYDIYHGDEEKIRRLKEDTKELFEHGIRLYQEGRFFDARTAFINVIKRNPYDKVAKLYFYLCDEYFQKGTPKNWNGNLIVSDEGQIRLSEQFI